MNPVKQISILAARKYLQEETAIFLDIRDPNSYEQEHIQGAIHISDANIESLLSSADKNKTTIVYCYHGISSLGAVGYFQEQGFADVASLVGGFEAWRLESDSK